MKKYEMSVWLSSSGGIIVDLEVEAESAYKAKCMGKEAVMKLLKQKPPDLKGVEFVRVFVHEQDMEIEDFCELDE